MDIQKLLSTKEVNNFKKGDLVVYYDETHNKYKLGIVKNTEVSFLGDLVEIVPYIKDMNMNKTNVDIFQGYNYHRDFIWNWKKFQILLKSMVELQHELGEFLTLSNVPSEMLIITLLKEKGSQL